MEKLIRYVDHLNQEWSSKEEQCIKDGMKYMFVKMYLDEDGTVAHTTGEYPGQFDLYYKHTNNLNELQYKDIAKYILEEFEKQKQEGLFTMMDKIHENSEKLNEQIENDLHVEKIKTEEYEKTFLFKKEESMDKMA